MCNPPFSTCTSRLMMFPRACAVTPGLSPWPSLPNPAGEPSVDLPALNEVGGEDASALSQGAAVGEVKDAVWSLELEAATDVDEQAVLPEDARAIKGLSGVHEKLPLQVDVRNIQRVEQWDAAETLFESR